MEMLFVDKSCCETESDAQAEPDGTGQKLNAAEGDTFLNHTTPPEFYKQSSLCHRLKCTKNRVQEEGGSLRGGGRAAHRHQQGEDYHLSFL